MDRGVQNQGGNTHHQDISVDPRGLESDETKAGEIQALRAFESGAEKLWKEHIPRKGKDHISEEGQRLLDDTNRWHDKTTLHRECYESRKRERINGDGSF
jgi:hypothetical protein